MRTRIFWGLYWGPLFRQPTIYRVYLKFGISQGAPGQTVSLFKTGLSGVHVTGPWLAGKEGLEHGNCYNRLCRDYDKDPLLHS